MKRIAISLFALSLLAAGSYSAPVNAATQHQDASLRFVSKDSTLIGVSFGLSAVDGQDGKGRSSPFENRACGLRQEPNFSGKKFAPGPLSGQTPPAPLIFARKGDPP